MNKSVLKILLFIFIAVWCFTIPAKADDKAPLTERVENAASVSINSSGISLKVNSDKVERFYIFSITGQLVKTVDVDAGITQTVDLPKGCYIIKCSFWSKKVLVK